MIMVIFWTEYFKENVRNFVKWKLVIMFEGLDFFSILTERI